MKPTSPIRFLLSNRAPWSSYSLRRRHPSGRVDLGDTSKIDAGFAAAIKMHFTKPKFDFNGIANLPSQPHQ
jgi:hypothetical protein